MVYIGKSVTLKLNQGAPPGLFEKARELRKKQTEAEKILWNAIRSRKCYGLKFRRQHPIASFILDFYCHEHLIAIEVDGGIHMSPDSLEYDKYRSSILEELGIKVLRFTNKEVINELDSVLEKIKQVVFSLQSTERENI